MRDAQKHCSKGAEIQDRFRARHDTLVKEIGSDALFAMLRVLDGAALDRARAYYDHCRDGDLAVAVAQTDVKGDRSLAPSAQADPDLYVRVVDTSDAGYAGFAVDTIHIDDFV